jgi:hypothetical protein
MLCFEETGMDVPRTSAENTVIADGFAGFVTPRKNFLKRRIKLIKRN